MNRSTLVWAAVLLVAAGLAGLRQASSDIAVLRTKDADFNARYTTLWVVEGRRSVWIRAAKPDRRWLADIRPDVTVRLDRDGSREFYKATIMRDEAIRRRVDSRMREKYRVADWLRELLLGDDTVPVRLVPLDRRRVS
ncbi:MAG: hypothetical protein V3V67_11380 [Myxococcota bacterium]